ncbi:MAG: hypothetical protein K0R00_165 [Herbinix sp.]|jgi:hypothetical protein|nr:hypothetical protein [Herbinix sp.]
MSYKEPGVYLNLVTNAKLAAGSTPMLIPMVIGSGAKIAKRTDVITRAASGNLDYLPANAETILAVGTTTRKPTYFETVDLDVKDFIHNTGENFISWETSAVNKPAVGEAYYVTYTYKVTEDQYEPRLIFLDEEIDQYYGPEFKENEPDPGTGIAPINRISVAGRIMLEAGAPAIYMLQVAPNETTGNVTAVEYKAALDKHARFLPNVWRIVPADAGADINSAIDAHVEECSSYEERKERTTVYGAPFATAPTDFNDVYEAVGGYAASKAFKRISVPYPDTATKLMSDGNYHELDAPFIAAAYAGVESALPTDRSKTRAEIKVFNTLKGIKMTRKQMNMLAEKGVMILVQPNGPGTSITIRHQVTTDMTSVQTKENSIVMIGDYVAKYLRGICEQYIGKYNITGETIARIQGTLDSAMYQLKKEKVITTGTIANMAQDEANPDTLLISVRVKPPYPCNYIEITLFLD